MTSKIEEIELHPGHWDLLNSGANGILNEVTEARKVTRRVAEILKAAKVPYTYYEDNVSKNKTDNVNHLIKEHNKDRNGLIVSIHFNASAGTHNRGIGTEVLYYNQQALAAKLAKAISEATGGGLLNRGAKQRKDLGVLARTYEPAVLIEVCFVNSSVDAAIYRRDFEKICQAIARVLAEYLGKKINSKEEEGLTLDQYNQLKKLIEAQAKTIEKLEEALKNKADAKGGETVGAGHKAAWDWALKEGLIKGDGVNFNPSGTVSRQQIATILHRYHEKYIKK